MYSENFGHLYLRAMVMQEPEFIGIIHTHIAEYSNFHFAFTSEMALISFPTQEQLIRRLFPKIDTYSFLIGNTFLLETCSSRKVSECLELLARCMLPLSSCSAVNLQPITITECIRR